MNSLTLWELKWQMCDQTRKKKHVTKTGANLIFSDSDFIGDLLPNQIPRVDKT